jgi:Zn-finger domain-containing protein
MFIQPNYEGNGLITDSRRIEVFFIRNGLAQRYLLNMKWMDKETKKEYKEHLLYKRRRREALGYGKTGLQYCEYQDGTGLIPQIEDTFRNVLIEEAARELERKTGGIRDPLIKKRVLENCRRCRDDVLTELDSRFMEYYKLLKFEMVDEVPTRIFEYGNVTVQA